MRRLTLGSAIVLVAILAVATGSAGAHGAGTGATEHCRNTYFGPFHTTITKISAKGAGCSSARSLSLA